MQITEEYIRHEVSMFLLKKIGVAHVPFSVIGDGDNCWAFWVHETDDTSYVHLHEDGKLYFEWYGTNYGTAR